jgi:sigma-B regulation protein RsbU (phosphoserine phosphatase)
MLLTHDGRSQLLNGNGIALGVLPHITLQAHAIHLHPNDTLLLYTDGVTEAINEDFDEFGLERMRLAAQNTHSPHAQGILQAITNNIQNHVGGTAQFDDITLVVLKRHPTQ